MRKSILQLTELPPRAEKLSQENLKEIFGGNGHCDDCSGKNEDCNSDILHCVEMHDTGGRHYCLYWGESYSDSC